MAAGRCTITGCGARPTHMHGIHPCCGRMHHCSLITGQHMARDIGDNFLEATRY